jgi:hypothetical protein
MAKRRTRADQERIAAEVAVSVRNRQLPEIPDSEKIMKRMSCGHDQLLHPDYQPGDCETCEDCVWKRVATGAGMWAKMPPR